MKVTYVVTSPSQNHRHFLLIQYIADLVTAHAQQHHVMAQVTLHGCREVLPVAIRHNGMAQVFTLMPAHHTPAGQFGCKSISVMEHADSLTAGKCCG
jgi:hypothetical protein